MWSNIRKCVVELCPDIGIVDALGVYVCDTEGISGIKSPAFFRSMPMPLLSDASEVEVVPFCRDVRGEVDTG